MSLNNGSATIIIPAGGLPAGSDQLTATYSGDGNYNSQTNSAMVTVGAPGTNLVEPVGTTSGTQTTTILFSSGLTLGSINVLTQGAPNLDFVAVSGGTCAVGTTYSAGQTCTVNYTFTPTAPWQRMGAIVIEDGSGNVQATQYISGTGTGPQAVMYPGTGAWIPYGANGLSGISIDDNGNLYLADPVHNQVLKETPSGFVYTQSTLGSGLSSPEGVAVDGGGNIYIADTSNKRILKETPFGGSYVQSTVTGGLNYPFGVAVDSSGNVYVADTFNNRVLKETLSSGNYTQSIVVGSGLSSPEYVAVDDSGSVYVVDTSNSRVVKETPQSNGNYTQSTVTSGVSAAQGTTAIQGIAVDGGGDVYVANGGASRVLRETLSGGSYVESTLLNIGFYPGGITIDSSGNLYIPNNPNGSVWKVDVSESWYLMNFASTAVGSTSSDSPQTVTAWNIGNAALTFPIPSSGNDPSISANFTLNSTGGTACPLTSSTSSSVGTLAAETSCALPISFVPTSGGSNGGLLRLVDNDLNVPNATQEIYFSAMGTGTATLKSIMVTPASSAISTGNTQQFTATGTYSDASTQNLTGTVGWISGNTGVATIGSSGLTSAVGAGSANVTAILNSVTSNVAVLTITAPVTLTSITITPASSTIVVGSTQQFTVTGTYSDSSTQDMAGTVGWTSSNTSVAAIDASGLTTAVAAGTTNISASLNGVSSNTAVLAVASGAYTAPTEPVGTTSSPQTVTIFLSSSFTLGSISVVTQGATGLDFNYASGGTCATGTAYTAGQICTVNFTFTPIASGQRMGAIVITDGSGNVQAMVYICGMGTGPEAVFSPGIISTVAGNGTAGYNNDGIAATNAELNVPGGIAVDSAGNIFIADFQNNRIRKVSASTGIISTVAGNGTGGYNGDGIAATSAEIYLPDGVAVDGAGNIYIADDWNCRIRKVNTVTGLISTVAGNGTCGYGGDGIAATSSQINPGGVAVDSAGNIYVVGDSRIRMVSASTGLISTVAGNGTPGYTGDGIAAISAELNIPASVAVDSTGNIFIADFQNNRIRKVSASTGLISTVVGNGTGGYNGDGIAATSAELNGPSGVAVDSAGNIYIADTNNQRIRKMSASTGLIGTVPVVATSVAVDSIGNIYFSGSNRIQKVSASVSGLSFASTAIGSTSSDSPQTVTLWNNGNTALTLPIPTSGNNPSIASNFTLNSTGGTACPLIGSTSSSVGTLAAGASCTLPISFAPTAAGTISGSLVVTDNSMNGSNVTQTISLGGTATSTQASQTITFTPPSSPVTYGVSPITLSASASSGLAVTFSVLSRPGTVSGSTLTVTGVGTIVIAANQAGNSNYTAATQVTQSIVVNQASPTITFTVPNHTYGDAPFTVTATSNSSGAITYSVVSGPATISGSTVTLTGAGTVVLQTSQVASGNYAAKSQTATFTIAGNAPTISFTVPNHTYGDAPFTVAATSNSSGAITYSVVSGSATISGSTVTLTGAGSVVLQASQVAAGNYTAGTQTATVTVAKESQAITFTQPTSPVTYGVAPITLSASASSGLAVAFNVVSGPATISGSTLTITGAGTVVVAANQAGNTNYAAATQVTQSITVNPTAQTITFTAPTSPVTYGVSPIALVATGGASGNAVVFSIVSGPAIVSGSTLTITGVGTVVVAANQTGNANYAAATQVTQSIVVNVIGVAATPTFSPVAGTYTAAQTVTISDTTAGATIYYTTNGTTPTTSSTVYSGTITVSSTETLEAIATATGYSTSAVASAAYTISIPTNPVPAISGISPAFTNAGGTVFTLTVNGSGFIASSTVNWGTSTFTTTYVSATQLTTQVPVADIATAGTIAITVQNPAPGGGTSNAWQFEVDSASSGSTAPTITSTTETVAAGSTANYPVTVPSSVTSVYVTCLNLPAGASCSYSSTTNTVTIATSSTTPKGTYQIIVVFTETVSGAASGFILLPILLLPLGFMRRKLAARGIWISACLGFVLLATAALSIGCGGGSSGGSSSTTPPATHQVTSSGSVSLTIQ
jgi:sugar lactone lactonase YvrE